MLKKIGIYMMITLTISLMGACREDELELNDPIDLLDYTTPSGQFEAIWQSMLTSYIMWDVDSTDWDAIYEEYMPKFEALDDQEYVATSDMKTLYENIFKGIRDHHLSLHVYNYWAEPDEDASDFWILPYWTEVKSRNYYHEMHLNHCDSMEDLPIVAHLRQLEKQGKASQIKYGYFTDERMDIVTALVDEGIPYIYFSGFSLSPLIKSSERDESATAAYLALKNFQNNVLTLPDNQIEGVILDVRGNGGGYVADYKYLLGILIDKPLKILESRNKTGLGKYDYSVWTPYYYYPSDQHRTGFTKPIVVLADVNSASMAEVTSLAVRNIPNSCIIGERTTGAMGILGYEYSTYYSGTFGEEDGPHYCYMSDHLNRTVNGEVLEGIGVTPDISLKFNLAEVTEGNDTWMDRAISYIQNGN